MAIHNLHYEQTGAWKRSLSATCQPAN